MREFLIGFLHVTVLFTALVAGGVAIETLARWLT